MTPFNRRLLYFILIYTCVEGLVINVTFPSKVGYVVKDVLIALAGGLLLIDNQGQPFGSLRRLAFPLGIFALIQTAYLVMPGDLPLLARLVGLKMRLLYVLMMLLGYRLVRSAADVYTLMAVLILAAVPVSVFGIYLYFSGPSALQAIGGSYSAVIYATTGAWRVPGTFNSPGQFGLYLTFNSVLAIGLLLLPGLSFRMRVFLWSSLALMTLATLASGSRSPMVLTVAAAGMVMLGLGRLGRIVSVGVGAYVVLAIGFATLGAGVEERVGSIVSGEHIERLNRTYFGQLFLPKMMETPMGLGLGTATIGARHFTEFGEVLLIESYFGIIAVETGVLGLVAILVLSAAAVVFLLKARLIMRNAPSGPMWYALASFSMIVLLLGPVSTPLDSAPGNVYFWLSIGIVAKLYDLERQSRAARLPGADEAAVQPV